MIRPRQTEDLERLVGVLRAVYLADGYPANWPNEPTRWLGGGHTIGAWVAEADGDLVGHVALTAAGPEQAWPGWHGALGVPSEMLGVIRRLFVAPGWRRRGVGDRLIRRAADKAAEEGLQLVLDVADHNRTAIRFWERRGWRPVGHAALPPGDEGRPLRLILYVPPAASGDHDSPIDT